jgi:hypothetical protein
LRLVPVALRLAFFRYLCGSSEFRHGMNGREEKKPCASPFSVISVFGEGGSDETILRVPVILGNSDHPIFSKLLKKRLLRRVCKNVQMQGVGNP